MPIQKPRVPEPKEFVNLSDFIGEVVAIRKTAENQVPTAHGEQTVYEVDLVTPKGTMEAGIYCFWRDVQRQLDAAGGDWIAGLIRKEDLGRGFNRYVIDADRLGSGEMEVLEATVADFDAEKDDIPF